jgi:Dyp-type peroxidase family
VIGLDRADIQGNVLRGYGFAAARYLFAEVRDAGPARGWLAALEVTSEERRHPVPTLNVALTHAGLRALGVPEHVLRSFPAEFRAGMAARAGCLGDEGPSAPEAWEATLRGERLHVLLTVTAPDAAAAGRRAEELTGAFPAHGLALVHDQPAATLAGRREHFGFTDGFSQPAFRGAGREAVRGQGVPVRWRPWHRWRDDIVRSRSDRRVGFRALAPGELVLGYPDEDRARPPAPAAPFDRNATFMVWRKLAQDVAGFRRFLASAAQATGLSAGLVAAKVVGRWPDGSPLVLRPERGEEALGWDKERVNDFSYARDRDGLRCPRGAHVRRANPRDAFRFGGTLTARHRIVRRGVPYGDPLPEGALDDDGRDRGLIFIALQADIERQFEIVQVRWCNDGDAFGLGHAVDPLAGAIEAPTRVTFDGRPPRYATALRSYVTTRGGAYLFVPGIRALRALGQM